MRYLATVQYKGTGYCGWQKQNVSKLPSVQEEIEKILSKILNEDIKIFGSGRTDAGVHALGQTFHFNTGKHIDFYKFSHGFNELIPNDIVLVDLKEVDENFHARFSAKGKTYLYKIENKNHFDPFNENLAYQLKTKLDLKAMEEASKVFVGEHNFQNFTSKEEDDNNFGRNISKISFVEDEKFINIELTGNGFMRYMVRMIVGNLVQVGLGKLTKEEIEKNLNSNIRKPSSFKAPSEGLYLKEVLYN